jgi:hypothetical protein
LRIVGVVEGDGSEEERAQVASKMRRGSFPPLSYLDVDGVWHEAAGIGIVPAFLVVDRQGGVVYRHVDLLEIGTPSFARLVAAIAAALEG